MSEAFDFDAGVMMAPWLAVDEVSVDNGFGEGREQSRFYLRREHDEGGEVELGAMVDGLRRFLVSLEFIEDQHDNDSTVFQSTQTDVRVMLHRWKGALKKSRNLPGCPECAPAHKVNPLDIDTAGWTIAIKGDGREVRAITDLIEGCVKGATPRGTKGGSVMYSVGYMVRHGAFLDEGVSRWVDTRQGMAM